MTAPFQTEAFRKTGDIAGTLNEWFETLAQDEANEYDIRQILDLGIALMVFYEVTPVDPVTCKLHCRPACAHIEG